MTTAMHKRHILRPLLIVFVVALQLAASGRLAASDLLSARAGAVLFVHTRRPALHPLAKLLEFAGVSLVKGQHDIVGR